ncbi:MAG TPA: hypothetical protein VGR82_11530 [Methylomirabilota bacterium]|jgi:hypothetical protein|nr:hypothetical protein [Methylomirabilota bacterium]
MARYRPSRFLRWLRASLAVAAYLTVVGALFEVADAGAAPLWVVIAVPPFFYVVLSLVALRRSSFAHRLAWTGAACIVHALLGTAAALELSAIASLMPLPAFAQAFAHLGPTPILTLIATPVVLAPFRRRVLPSRAPSRAERAARAPLPTPPTASGQTPFAREAIRREGVAEAAPATVVGAEPPPPPAPPAPPRPAAAAPADERVVRVPFDRVASQLPAEAFVLPFDRLAESLRQPHYLLVPRRVVLQHLPDGAVEIDWALVSPQFPALALGMSELEFRQKYPDLKLSLPVDELLRQLPDDILAVGAGPSEIPGLEAFPPPFQPYSSDDPHAAPPVPAAAPALAAAPVAPAAPTITPPPAAIPPAAPAEVVTPAATTIATPSVASVAPAPVAAVTQPPEPAPTPRAPAKPAAQSVVDRETLARLSACFTGIGTFDGWSGAVDDVALIAFVAPSLPRDAVTAIAARVAGLLGDAAGEQVTVRTARAAVVVTAAPTPIVVGARRPGAPLALLELRAARAAGLAGPRAAGGATPTRALSTLTVDPRVAGVAATLGAFGGVEPAVLADGGGGRVYVFRERGREAERVAALALAAWEGVARARDAELGSLVSIVFRQGRRRTLVRPVGGGDALLAATGPVARPGRAWREADRAAAALEAR